jgi:hypothetical protein
VLGPERGADADYGHVGSFGEARDQGDVDVNASAERGRRRGQEAREDDLGVDGGFTAGVEEQRCVPVLCWSPDDRNVGGLLVAPQSVSGSTSPRLRAGYRPRSRSWTSAAQVSVSPRAAWA